MNMWSLWEERQQQLARINGQARDWLSLIYHTLRQTFSPETALIAASISYFTLFSTFPLILLTVAIASNWLDPMLAEAEIVTKLEFAAPGFQQLLGNNLESIVEARGQVTGLAALVLIWSSSHIFHIMTRGLERIWGLDETRAGWQHRGVAIFSALVFSGLLLTALLFDAIWAAIRSAIPFEFPFQEIPVISNEILGVLLNIAIFAALYYFLPHIKGLSLFNVLPGAAIAGTLWAGAKALAVGFVSGFLTSGNLVYGSVVTIIAFLSWAYFSGLIFVSGALLNANLYKLRNHEPF